MFLPSMASLFWITPSWKESSMRRFLPLLLISALFAPVAASAQGFAVAGHAGTLGLGGSMILGLSPRLNVRGAAGTEL